MDAWKNRCAVLLLGSSCLGACDDHILVSPEERWVDAAAYGEVTCGLTNSGLLRCSGLDTVPDVTTFDGWGTTVCALRPQAVPPLQCQTLGRDPISLSRREIGGPPVDLVVTHWGHAYVVREDGEVLLWSLYDDVPSRIEGLPPLRSIDSVGQLPGSATEDTRLCGANLQGDAVCARVLIDWPGKPTFSELDLVSADHSVAVLNDLLVVRGLSVAIDDSEEAVDLAADYGWTDVEGMNGTYTGACVWSSAGDVVCLDAEVDPATPPLPSSAVGLPAPARSVRVSLNNVCAVLDGGAIACRRGSGDVVDALYIQSEGPDDPNSFF